MVIEFVLRLTVLCTLWFLSLAPASATDYASLYAKISPAVVTVNTRKIATGESGVSFVPGVGAGVLIKPTLILTAAHVVKDVDFIRIHFNDDTYINAQVLASVAHSDIALLKLAKPHPRPVLAQIGNSDDIQVGSSVFIIGSPYGVEQSLSVGYLSGRMSRGKLPDGTAVEFLQTDSAINPGNSGGPMLNAQGEVVGIVSFILSKSGGFDGVEFATAINSAHRAIKNSSGYIAGFEGVRLTSRLAQVLSVPEQGILVQRVATGTIAHELGLKAGTLSARIGSMELLLGGDVIVSVNCMECHDSGESESAAAIARKLNEDKSLRVTLFRDGESITITKKAKPPLTQHLEVTDLFLLCRQHLSGDDCVWR